VNVNYITSIYICCDYSFIAFFFINDTLLFVIFINRLFEYFLNIDWENFG